MFANTLASSRPTPRALRFSVLFGVALLFAAPAFAAEFTPGHLFVASSGNDSVLEFDEAGTLVGTYTAGTDLDDPAAVAFGPDGRLYVASRGTGTVVAFSEDGSYEVFTLSGGSPEPTALVFGPHGRLYVVEDDNDKLHEFDLTTDAETDVIDLPSGNYTNAGVAIGPGGHLFVTDANDAVVREIDLRTGEELRELGDSDLTDPRGLVIGPTGMLYVADATRVALIDANGDEVGEITDASLADIRGLHFGRDGHLYVANNGVSDETLKRFDGTGTLVGTVADAGLSVPQCGVFAPWRFIAKIKGLVNEPGEPIAKPKEVEGAISITPGSGVIMLALSDNVTASNDLVSLFGFDFIVFHGYEGVESALAKKRLYHGTQFAGPALGEGVASIVLEIQAQEKKGVFILKKGKGRMYRAGSAGVYVADVQTNKQLL
ncbi:MAG: NHL repeat-containing protein [Planctomycetota bacterium]|jgi:outer membrane protein assembly factor BamB